MNTEVRIIIEHEHGIVEITERNSDLEMEVGGSAVRSVNELLDIAIVRAKTALQS